MFLAKTRIIEIEPLRAGQPKTYAVSIYEYLVTLNWSPPDPEEYIRRLVKGTLDHHCLRDSSAVGDWWTAYIDGIKRVGDKKWKVSIKQDYLG